MHTITKEFDFCYGHRVWSQQLNAEYSLDSCLKCRHLHGHQGKILVSLTAESLADGMVTDFKHLNWFKKWVDDILDHKFIMDINDPLLIHEVPVLSNNKGELIKGRLVINEDYAFIPSSLYENEPTYLQEKYEGMVFVNFVPTSENLSKWFYQIVTKKMSNLGIKVSSVKLFETPKSSAYYSE